jgi:pimeloyl-ACP methyl ester carboxylesterase
MRPRGLGLAAFAGAAAAGAALAWAAERRTLGRDGLGADPAWAELQRPVPGEPLSIDSFDGTTLHAEALGPAHGPTLVWAHGYGMSQHFFTYQRRDLRADHRLVFYDQRGHARSEEAASGDYSIAALGRDFAAVLDAAVPAGQRVVAVGHSLGGMTILAFAEQFPEVAAARLAGVVLIGTSGSDVLAGVAATVGIAALAGLQRRAVDAAFSALGRRARTADRVYAASNDLSYLLTRAIGLNPNASPAHVAFVEQLLLNCSNTVKAALGPTLTSLDLREAARSLAVPALVLVGSLDRLTPPASARRLVELLPHGRLVELPGVGHNAPLEAADAVNDQIRAFAADVVRAAA